MEMKQPRPTRQQAERRPSAPPKKRTIHMPRTYRGFEKLMARVLGMDVMVFLIYLMAAARGLGGLKGILAAVALVGAALSLGFLFLNRELNRPRSRWLSTGFMAVVLCLLVSLLFRYPSPAPTAADIAPNAVSITAEASQNEAGGQA